jgi:hypothetical protein
MKMGYKAALQWLLDNDDTEWLDDEFGSISVTACLVADIYNKDQDKVIADLRKRKEVTR